MADYLPVPSSGFGPARYERKLMRASSRELGLIRAREGLTMAKVEAVEMAGQAALSSVAALSMMELAYAQRDPHAAARLTYITDQATFAIGRQITRLERNL